jgi:hypothetical protein
MYILPCRWHSQICFPRKIQFSPKIHFPRKICFSPKIYFPLKIRLPKKKLIMKFYHK